MAFSCAAGEPGTIDSVWQDDRVAWANSTRLHDRRIEAAQAPAGRVGVALLHLRIVQRRLNAGAVDIERRARRADSCKFDYGAPRRGALPQPQCPPIETSCCQVLTQRPCKDRKPPRDELVD